MDIILFLIYIFLFVTHRRICNMECTMVKKMIIPVVYLLLSLVMVWYVSDVLGGENARVQTYTSMNEPTGSIVVSKKIFDITDFINLFVVFNIPTMIGLVYVFTGTVTNKHIDCKWKNE